MNVAPQAKVATAMDLAVVVYEPDVLSLKLQARSLSLFFRHRDVGRIFIIVNELAPDGTYAALANEVLPEYGHLLGRVEVIPATRLMRPHVSVTGWHTQQSLKLLVSRLVASETYLLLDAKNHFIRPVSARTFVDPATGKIKTFRLRKPGPAGKYFSNALSYFGQEMTSETLPASTPFVMLTSVVRDLVAAIEEREAAYFDDFMHSPGREMSEFALYFAFLKSKDDMLERLHRFGPRTTVALGSNTVASAEQVVKMMTNLNDERSVCFALHRSRAGALDAAASDRIVAFWVQQGLFSSIAEAQAFFDRLRHTSDARTLKAA